MESHATFAFNQQTPIAVLHTADFALFCHKLLVNCLASSLTSSVYDEVKHITAQRAALGPAADKAWNTAAAYELSWVPGCCWLQWLPSWRVAMQTVLNFSVLCLPVQGSDSCSDACRSGFYCAAAGW